MMLEIFFTSITRCYSTVSRNAAAASDEEKTHLSDVVTLLAAEK